MRSNFLCDSQALIPVIADEASGAKAGEVVAIPRSALVFVIRPDGAVTFVASRGQYEIRMDLVLEASSPLLKAALYDGIIPSRVGGHPLFLVKEVKND